MKDVVSQFGLGKYFRLEHLITSARWDASIAKWHITGTNSDGEFNDSCDVLINACGLLNNWKWPSIPGLDKFKGEKFHSARWPENIDLAGKRVALIGVGSTGIQILPRIQPIVQKATVYVRSPTWVAPPREGSLLSPEVIERYKEHPEEHLE
jgi:cation diffusion facilitator CzcD-associated flavoprotein CzcO